LAAVLLCSPKIAGWQILGIATVGTRSSAMRRRAGGRTLAEVRDAAGHSNVSITSGYLHVTVDDDEVGALFG